MSVLMMHKDFRKTFPNISKLVDEEHIHIRSNVSPNFSYSWFISLAKTMNFHMREELNNVRWHQAIFEFIRNQYIKGDINICNCIDSTFIENIFWLIRADLGLRYWEVFPVELKNRYIDIHLHYPMHFGELKQ